AGEELLVDITELMLLELKALDGGIELATLLLAAELVTPEQTDPVTTGVSTLPLLVLTCKPNSTVWPGWMVLFQLRLLAEYGLLPLRLAFQLLLIRLVL